MAQDSDNLNIGDIVLVLSCEYWRGELHRPERGVIVGDDAGGHLYVAFCARRAPDGYRLEDRRLSALGRARPSNGPPLVGSRSRRAPSARATGPHPFGRQAWC
jgi:hypothetical protein